LNVRERACVFIPDEPRHYFAQMQAYQVMPDEEMLTVQDVALKTPMEQIVSRPSVRVNCDLCGEEIMNEREVHHNRLVLCQPCAHGGYYQGLQNISLRISLEVPTQIETSPIR
jgi:formylmethanofuran dehydrogenase subunit E